MKVVSWVIALCGLWEAGDIAALFTPGFGKIQPYLWNHIAVGVILMIAGAWAALTRSAATAKILHWISAFAGGWLIAASFILRSSFPTAGMWNDIIVGVIVLILAVWSVFKAPRVSG